MKNFLTLLFLLILTGRGDVLAQGETIRTNTPINDSINGYYEYLPQSYYTQPQKKFPLFIFIHGVGVNGDGSAEQMGRIYNSAGLVGGVIQRLHQPNWYPGHAIPQSFTVNGENFEYIYIAPQFRSDPAFNGGGAAQANKFINDIIDYCIAHYRVDKSRIYLSGQSAGGAYIVDYLAASTQNAQRVAAVAFASAASIIPPDKATNITSNKIGTWFAAAIYDPYKLAPYAQANVDNINAATPKPDGIYKPVLQLFDDNPANHGTAAVYLYDPLLKVDGKNVYEFLLQFRTLSALPVTGLKLTAQPKAQSVAIQWSAVSEINSSKYSVERSSDAENFETLTTVASKNSASGAAYAYSDNLPLDGKAYYRIRQTDIDGNVSFSDIVSVQFSSGVSLRVYPNPVKNTLTLETNQDIAQNSILRIFDNAGKLYKSLRLSNANRQTINISDLPKGIYVAKIFAGKDEQRHFSFVKE